MEFTPTQEGLRLMAEHSNAATTMYEKGDGFLEVVNPPLLHDSDIVRTIKESDFNTKESHGKIYCQWDEIPEQTLGEYIVKTDAYKEYDMF